MKQLLYKFGLAFKSVDIRFILLICVLLTLPALEALKNLFSILFVISWVILAKRNNDWGGNWRVIDSIFLLWILADIFVSINAVITHQFSGAGFRDIIRFVLIGWVVSRIRFSREQLTQSAIFALVATVLTLIYSYYAGEGNLVELYSVGHINHTAIYLIICYVISLSLLLFNFNHLNSYQKPLVLLTTIVFFLTTLDAGSRATSGLLVIITIFSFLYFLIKVKKLTLALGCIGGIFSAIILSAQHPVYELKKIQQQISQFQDLSHILDDSAREKIYRFSYHAFKTNPFFGVGFGNFGQIQIEDIRASIIKDKKVFNGQFYTGSAHAHNVYFNYLVSGGLLAFSIFAWFWLYTLWIIIKHVVLNNIKLYKAKFPENEWILLSSIGVFFVNIGIGFVNTTLHHEHAILSMFVLGLLIGQYRIIESVEELSG
jgi:O-antigen ligase